MSLDAMKQALDALEQYTNVVTSVNDPNSWATVSDGGKPARDAITALRAAIEQEQEPVAHTLNCVCGAVWDVSPHGVEEMVHAPTPPPRQWQGLTDEERGQVINANFGARLWQMAKDIEAKLKEKNT